MRDLKESDRITLADGLAILLKNAIPAEQAKIRLRQAFIQKAFNQSPAYAFSIDWATGSVKIPRRRERFVPTFRRSDSERLFFRDEGDEQVKSTLRDLGLLTDATSVLEAPGSKDRTADRLGLSSPQTPSVTSPSMKPVAQATVDKESKLANHLGAPVPLRPAQLTPDQKRAAIPRLRKRISELTEFIPGTIERTSDPRVIALEQAIERTLVHVFGTETTEYGRYKGITTLGCVPGLGGPTEIAQYRQYLEEDKAQAITVINGIITGFREDLEEFSSPISNDVAEAVSAPIARKVFVVHGHEKYVLAAVARFLEQLHLRPIMLSEQVSAGKTIIEKIETFGDVDFAVVLLTADDLGRAKAASTLEPRVRQNVLLELGYFMGRLGRENVCALKEGEIEIPTDFAGVAWHPFDDHEGWKRKLAQELEHAGYSIDWKVLGK